MLPVGTAFTCAEAKTARAAARGVMVFAAKFLTCPSSFRIKMARAPGGICARPSAVKRSRTMCETDALSISLQCPCADFCLVPGAFFTGSPSRAASVFESNKSVTLTFYSVLSGALGANFKKISFIAEGVFGLHLKALSGSDRCSGRAGPASRQQVAGYYFERIPAR